MSFKATGADRHYLCFYIILPNKLTLNHEVIFTEYCLSVCLPADGGCSGGPGPKSARGGFVLEGDSVLCTGQTLRLRPIPGLQNVQYRYPHTGTAVPISGRVQAESFTCHSPGR